MGCDYEATACVFKALCNPVRLEVLELLRSGEKCACELNERIDVSPSTLSHHMGVLVRSGIVASWQEGKWVHYAIDPAGCKAAADLFSQVTTVRAGGGAPSCCR